MRGMPSAAFVVQIILSHVVFIGGLHTPREFSVLVHFMTKRIVPPGTGFGPSNVLRQSSPEAVEVSNDVHQPTTPVESKPFTEAEVINRKGFVTDRSRRLEGLKEKIKQLNDAGIRSSGTVPDIIADRMLRRIVMFFGAPVMIGLLLFVGAFVYSQRTGEKIPATLVAYATQLPFALGLAGITWGILSSSWDVVSALRSIILCRS